MLSRCQRPCRARCVLVSKKSPTNAPPGSVQQAVLVWYRCCTVLFQVFFAEGSGSLPLWGKTETHRQAAAKTSDVPWQIGSPAPFFFHLQQLCKPAWPGGRDKHQPDGPVWGEGSAGAARNKNNPFFPPTIYFISLFAKAGEGLTKRAARKAGLGQAGELLCSAPPAAGPRGAIPDRFLGFHSICKLISLFSVA